MTEQHHPFSTDTAAQGTVVRCAATEGFARWMSTAGGSVLVSTYQAGKVVLVGWNGRQVSLLMRDFDKPMGMAVSGRRLALATRRDIAFFANDPQLAHNYNEQSPGTYDALYLPRVTYHTGELAIHDLAFGVGGELWAVNTRFSCLCRVGHEYNFVPGWRPPFVKALEPEDRCHLNGLAVVDGEPRYVTALGQTNAPGGWRPGKGTGGVIVEVAGGEVVARGLSMPHSPRWHDGQLWVLNSGTGELCVVDPESGHLTVACALRGYLRGLAFVGPYALIGMCQIRESNTFGGLPIRERYPSLKCGVAVVDLRSGSEVGVLEFTAGCQEIYDVHFLPGVQRANILNLARGEGARLGVTTPDVSYWVMERPAGAK